MARFAVAILALLTVLAACGGAVGFIIVGAYIDLPAPQYQLALAALFAFWVAAPLAGLALAWVQRARGPGRAAAWLAGSVVLMLAGQFMIEHLPMHAV